VVRWLRTEGYTAFSSFTHLLTLPRAKYMTLSTGQFLIDRKGLIHWMRVQGVTDPPATLGNFPRQEEFFTAARGLAG